MSCVSAMRKHHLNLSHNFFLDLQIFKVSFAGFFSFVKPSCFDLKNLRGLVLTSVTRIAHSSVALNVFVKSAATMLDFCVS